jgi:hypothetical protein
MRRLGRAFILSALACCGRLAAVQPEAGSFGLGIQVGSITGANLKFWTGTSNAIELSLGSGNDGSLAVEGSDLYHVFGIFHSDIDTLEEQIPVYAGLGGMLATGNLGPAGVYETVASVHFVAGASYLAEGAPLDLFIEILPTLDLTPQNSFLIRSATGLRYYF